MSDFLFTVATIPTSFLLWSLAFLALIPAAMLLIEKRRRPFRHVLRFLSIAALGALLFSGFGFYNAFFSGGYACYNLPTCPNCVPPPLECPEPLVFALYGAFVVVSFLAFIAWEKIRDRRANVAVSAPPVMPSSL